MKTLIFSILLTSVLACSPSDEVIKTPKFYDLKGLITLKINELNASKPIFIKRVVVNNVAQTKEVKTLDWSKELEPILQTDINKAANSQSYSITTNSTGVYYVLKKGEKLPVKWLNIRPQNDELLIEGSVQNTNFLYQSERNISIFIKKNQLVSYKIDGFQQLFFGEKKPFLIEGKRK